MGHFSLAMITPIEVKTKTGVDSYGDPSYGPPRDLKCRLQINGERLRDASGTIIDVRDVIYAEEPIDEGDLILFEDGREAQATKASFSRAIGVNQPLYKVIL